MVKMDAESILPNQYSVTSKNNWNNTDYKAKKASKLLNLKHFYGI